MRAHRLNTRPKKKPEPSYQECKWYFKKLTSDTLTQRDLMELVNDDPQYAGYLVSQHYPVMGACFGILLYCRTLGLFDQFMDGYRNGRSSLVYNQRAFGHLYRVEPSQPVPVTKEEAPDLTNLDDP